MVQWAAESSEHMDKAVSQPRGTVQYLCIEHVFLTALQNVTTQLFSLHV
jgi:hypothetical protein